MLSRATATRALLARTTPTIARRAFQSSARLQADALPARKPVGAFRGGIFGFLFGSVVAGASVYYYVLEEYRVSNNLLNEDIYALQNTVQRLESYIKQVEASVTLTQKK